MVRSVDIHALSDFQRNARRHIQQLRRSGRANVLTLNGRAAVVIQDVAAYEKLLDRIDRAEAIAGIQRGIEDMRARRTRPVKHLHAAMKKRLDALRRA